MVIFEDALDVSPLDDGKNWVVLDDFYYDTDVCLSGPNPHRVVCEKGFQSDFASIPWPLWSIVGAPAEGKYRKIAVVHDKLYRTKGLATKHESDRVLLEGMEYAGTPRWTRYLIYAGV